MAPKRDLHQIILSTIIFLFLVVKSGYLQLELSATRSSPRTRGNHLE